MTDSPAPPGLGGTVEDTSVYMDEAGVVLSRLGVDPSSGLGSAAAAERLRHAGPNRLQAHHGPPWWRILADQFVSPVIVLLLLAVVLALAFMQFIEAAAIAAALLINGVIGFVTEWRARRSMESLQRLGQPVARVRRDGALKTVPADSLVPGDIVLLEEGDIVAADLRLIDVENLQCNESSLTGESVPVAKETRALQEAEPLLAERRNLAFTATAVTRGRGTGVVYATGMQTEIGRVAGLVQSAQEVSTPLERRLERLGKRLIYLVVAVGVAVAGSGIAAGRDLFRMIETGLVLAIAAVPEGLPIVATVALGRGMHRMARRNALVKRLSAVETLGATTVIFSDKTGTLTENAMVLRRAALPDGDVDIVRQAEGLRVGDGAGPAGREGLIELLEAVLLCSNAVPVKGTVQGDPTEAALVEGALAAGLDRRGLLQRLPELREESFDPATAMMATYHGRDGEVLIVVKGAPEAVLKACTAVRTSDGGCAVLDDAGREHWRARNQALAGEGLRVLAVARKAAADADEPPYGGLCLLGLAGLYDPPRESVIDAIRRCREAGIRVVMVTGDQPATAANIAHAVGIVDRPHAQVLTGRELDDASLYGVSIFARVTPEQKLRLVEAYQDEGEIVAMTGDGVNDAPALKKADIGIAMGRRGTEVARETSDVVLTDDAFESIVVAVEQGRVIFGNIRKFVVYLLSGNLGQILGVSAAAIAGDPLPLLPLQILFLNLLLDVFPALALGVGRGGADVMQRPPRDPAEPILARRHWLAVFGFGVLMAAALLGVFAFALAILRVEEPRAVTMAFFTYSFARLWHSFNMRSPAAGTLRNDVTSNRYIWGAIVLCGGLLSIAAYDPFLSNLLHLAPLTARQWLTVFAASLIPLIFGQLALAIAAGNRRPTVTPSA